MALSPASLWSYLFPLCVLSQGAGLRVKPSMHGKELPCLDICLYVLIWPGYYTSRVSDDEQGIDVDGSDLVLTIQLTSQDLIFVMTS